MAAAAAAQPEEPRLQGVSPSGSTWYAHLTIKTNLNGGRSKFTVNGLPTRRVAAHARDLLLLAKERLFGLSATHRHDRMHFQQQLYARLLPDVQRCGSMEEAASLITRLAERGELFDLARSSAAAHLAPQAVSRPRSALMGELEQFAAAEQVQQGQQARQQQQGQQPRRLPPQQQGQHPQPSSLQRQQRSGAAAAAAAAGHTASHAGSAGGRRGSREATASGVISSQAQAAQQSQSSIKVVQTGTAVTLVHSYKRAGSSGQPRTRKKNFVFEVVGEEERGIASDLMRLWRQLQLREPLQALRLENQLELYSQEIAELKRCGSPGSLVGMLRNLRRTGRMSQLVAATGGGLAAAAAGVAAAAASSGSSGLGGRRGRGRSIEAAQAEQLRAQEQQRRRQHLRWDEEEEEEEVQQQRRWQDQQSQRPPAKQQKVAQQPASPKKGKRRAEGSQRVGDRLSGGTGPLGKRQRVEEQEVATQQAQQQGWRVDVQREQQQQQQQQQQAAAQKGKARQRDERQQPDAACRRQEEQETAKQQEQREQQQGQRKGKMRQPDTDEQPEGASQALRLPEPAAQVGGAAQLEPGSPSKKKHKKERQRQQPEQLPATAQPQALQQHLAPVGGQEAGSQAQGAAAAAAVAVAAGTAQAAAAVPQPAAAVPPANAQHPAASQQPAIAQQAAGEEAPQGLPELPRSMPEDVPSPWWALNRLKPHLEQRRVCDAAQFSSFAWHFVDADGEEQRGLYATLAGCLRAGDAAGAARWVRKYGG